MPLRYGNSFLLLRFLDTLRLLWAFTQGAPEAFHTCWDSGVVSHVKKGATRLELLSMWGSAKMEKWRHSSYGQESKRGSSLHGNNCEKSRNSGILGMTFLCYAKDDVNKIPSIKYTTMCTTFHSCQHIVAEKNNYFIDFWDRICTYYIRMHSFCLDQFWHASTI